MDGTQFEFRQISDYGTSNPIVARLSIQTSQLCEPFLLDKDTKESVLKIYGFDVQPKLLECFRIADWLWSELVRLDKEIAKSGFDIQAGGRAVTVPTVLRLESQAETFLYNAKASLRELVKIINLFYHTAFNSPRYDKVANWASKKLGENDDLSRLVNQDHRLWIKDIIDRRNAVEHPNGELGPMRIQNTQVTRTDEGIKLIEPSWALGDGKFSSIRQDMFVFIDNFLEFAEDLLVILLKRQKCTIPVLFVEIPEKERDPKMPIRLRVTIDPSKIKFK